MHTFDNKEELLRHNLIRDATSPSVEIQAKESPAYKIVRDAVATIPVISSYLRLVHILNEFFFHHKWRKGVSNDIKSSWWNFIYICKNT